MFGLITLIATTAATAFGYFQSRMFVRKRLAYVDVIHRGSAPVIAGVAAAAIAIPVVFFVPLIGAGTAVLFGLGVGAGVSAGARDVRKRLPSGY
jgi:hypothetical protein